MPAYTKKTEKKAKSVYESSEANKTFKNVFEHYRTSWQDLVQPNINSFIEKEALMIGRPLDSITGQETHSGVFEPRLSTISLERAGRVMAQNPSGKSLSMSSNDRGKNMLMNLLQDRWVLPNANSQFSFLMKSRLWDLYSLMYGVMFALVDRVDTDLSSGPDFCLLPIRYCRPQPGRFSIKESAYFGVSTWVTPEWLMQRNTDTWKNGGKLLDLCKGKGSNPPGNRDSNERTFIEQERQPGISTSKDFKQIEIYTEYRNDKWITVAPEFESEKLILREIENPHGDDTIPVVAKYCFPLMDSIYGLGEFERGKTLQLALNSLWNMYLDGVKMSIFPPIQMVADDIVPSSILMEPAAKWLLTKPGAEIKSFNSSPQGMTTFQNTYNYLVGAILNMAGTTDTAVSAETDRTMGKTPQALKIQATRESTRDSWDRFMMEESLQELMKKFVNLNANGLDKEIELRLFAPEIQEIAKIAPDVVELVEGDERGTVKVNKDSFEGAKFDYQITKGSTYKADQDKEQENLTNIMNFTVQNYQLLEPMFRQKGKTIDLAELYQRSLIAAGTQDWEKIVRDLNEQETMGMQQEQQMMAGQQQQMAGMEQGVQQGNDMLSQIQQQIKGGLPQAQAAQAGQQVEQAVSAPQQGPLSGQFQDPAIAEFAAQMFG